MGDTMLRNAARLTDMGTLANPGAQAVRNPLLRFTLGFHAVQARLATTMSEIEIAYAKSPLSVGRHAGERLPPAQYAGPPPGNGTMPRFVLFAADRAAGSAAGSALAARFPGHLEAKPRTQPDAERLLIVRPDGYVGLTAAVDDWAAAERYLERLAS